MDDDKINFESDLNNHLNDVFELLFRQLDEYLAEFIGQRPKPNADDEFSLIPCEILASH